MLEKDLEIKSTNKQWRKLVDYYNERREEKFWEKWHFKYTMRFDHAHIISKKFWFIKWLVDNDKIDRDKIIEKSDFMPIVSNKVWDFLQPTEEQELLMVLSISDNPINDLITYLK